MVHLGGKLHLIMGGVGALIGAFYGVIQSLTTIQIIIAAAILGAIGLIGGKWAIERAT